jgi:hypothetical protein
MVFETLKRLWSEGKLTEVKLQNAVVKGYITQVQADEIKG